MWHKENEYVPDSNREVIAIVNETGNLKPYRAIGYYAAGRWYVEHRPIPLGCVIAWTELPALPDDLNILLLPPRKSVRQPC